MTGNEWKDPKIFKGEKERYALMEKKEIINEEESNDFFSKYDTVISAQDFEFEIEKGTNMEIEVSNIFPSQDLKQFIKILKNHEDELKTMEHEIGDTIIESFGEKYKNP